MRGRIFTAGALCLAALTLSSCNGSDQPLGAASPSPATTSSPQVPKATKTHEPKQKMVHSVVKGGGKASGALNTVVAQGQQALDSMLTPSLKKVYSDIRLKADPPSGVIYTYVFRNTVPSGAADGIDTQSSTFQNIFTTTLVPALKGVGLEHPTATFTFVNPDGSVIWTHKFTE